MRKFEVIDGGKKSTSSVNQRKVLGILRSVMIVLIILMVLFVCAKLLSDRREIGEVDFTSKKTNYIYEIDADAVLDMQSCNGGLVVLTPTNVLYVSRSGSDVKKNPHKYSNPAISVSGDRVLLFDRGSNAYRIENSGGILYDSKTDNVIINAGYGKNGSYYLASKGSDSLTALFVYDKKHQLIFQWKCASEYITTADVSPNGKQIAVAVTNAKAAVLYSKVHLFSLSSAETLASYDYDCALFSVQFISNKKAMIVGETVLSSVTSREREDVSTFSAVSSRKMVSDIDSENTAILLAKYGNDSSYELTVYKTDGRELLKKSFLTAVGWIDCSGRYAAAAYGTNVEIYNYSGKTVGSLILDSVAERILLDGTNIYVLTASGISVYGVSSHVSVSNTVPEQTTKLEKPDDSESHSLSQNRPIAAFTEPGTTSAQPEG